MPTQLALRPPQPIESLLTDGHSSIHKPHRDGQVPQSIATGSVADPTSLTPLLPARSYRHQRHPRVTEVARDLSRGELTPQVGHHRDTRTGANQSESTPGRT